MGGAPFEPVGVRTLASGVDVLMVPLRTQSKSGVRNRDSETHVSQGDGDTDRVQGERVKVQSGMLKDTDNGGNRLKI